MFRMVSRKGSLAFIISSLSNEVLGLEIYGENKGGEDGIRPQ